MCLCNYSMERQQKSFVDPEMEPETTFEMEPETMFALIL